MLKLIEFDTIGRSGLNVDLPPWALPIEFLTGGKNFRVAGEKILSSGGWVKIRIPAEADLGLSKALPISAIRGDISLFAGDWGLYSWDGAAYSFLKILNNRVDGRKWTFARMGGIPIACHPTVGIIYWNPVRAAVDAADAGTICQFLPYDKTTKWNQPEVRAGQIIRNHKTFLLLLNITENGVDMPDSFRWSHPADINSIPPTWDAESPDAQYFQAGIASLGANSGPIIDGLSMRDAFIVYSNNSINILQDTGDANWVFNRQQLTFYTGILATECVCEVKGLHFLMTGDDIVVNDGNSLNSIMHNRIRSHYAANLSQDRYENAFVVNNLVKKEIWFCIPTTKDGASEVDLAYIYNWKDESWAIRDLQPDTIFGFYGANATGILTWAALAAQSNPLAWGNANMPWNSDKTNPFDETILCVTSNSEVYDLDPESFLGTAVLNDTNMACNMELERTNIPLGDHRGNTTIVAIYIHAEGSGVLMVQVGSHDFAGSPVRWKEPVPFSVGKQRKINVRTTGELHAFNIKMSIGSCTISGMSIEYAEAGLR